MNHPKQSQTFFSHPEVCTHVQPVPQLGWSRAKWFGRHTWGLRNVKKKKEKDVLRSHQKVEDDPSNFFQALRPSSAHSMGLTIFTDQLYISSKIHNISPTIMEEDLNNGHLRGHAIHFHDDCFREGILYINVHLKGMISACSMLFGYSHVYHVIIISGSMRSSYQSLSSSNTH